MRLFSLLVILAAVVVSGSVGSASPLDEDRYWDADTALTVPPYVNRTEGAPAGMKLVVTENGEIHVVWHSLRPNPVRPQVYYKRFVPGTGWTPDTCISGDVVQRAVDPAIACDPLGNLHVGWTSQEGDVRCKMRSAAGIWDSASTVLLVGTPQIVGGYPSITCTPDSHVHVVWYEYRDARSSALVYRERVGTEWRPPCTVDSVDTTSVAYSPCIAGGRDNSVHLVWYGGPSWSPLQVYYKCRMDTVWGQREHVSVGSDSFYQALPNVTVNPVTNEPHVVWGGYNPSGLLRIYHTRRTGGGWQDRDTISETSVSTLQGCPSVVFTRDGVGHVVWQGTDRNGLRQVRYNERTASGRWLIPTDLTADSSAKRECIVINDGGGSPDSNHLYVVWTDERESVPEVYFKHGAPSPGGIEWDEEAPLVSSSARSPVVTGTGRLTYMVQRAGPVRLGVYDAAGRLARKLVDGVAEPGRYSVTWDGTDSRGRQLAGGVYFYRVRTADAEACGKVVFSR